ncbi:MULTISPECIES: GNAT family N-acetyltransferase [unclassified Enterococcus]|uniref:GNAT family N-acetyltransferase n=1 Tax=unclassified Enterococcus TaxID=2608891 RepID=UPI001A9B495B|nr:GNAT family N-acetyltransferase [Enterococcus sp. DIV1271a]MBO1298714.1 GNAT family N-acetyltransferase [Enterococcus sp. DIV1271a]
MIKKVQKLDQQMMDRLLTIWLKTNVETHDFIDATYWHEKKVLLKKELPKAEIYYYEIEGQIVGFMGIIDESYLAGIFVESMFQNKKIGQKLIEAAKKEKERIALHVYHKNQRAIRFYDRNGFRKVAEQIDESTNEKEYLMVWERTEQI